MTCHKVFVPFVLIWISVQASYEAFRQPYYQSPALYNFGWAVDDEASYNYYRQQESRNGDQTEGFYQVRLPDGRLQTVKYRVYKDSGFMADISYEGENDPYNYQRQSVYSPVYSPDYTTVVYPQPDPVQLRVSDLNDRYAVQPQSLSYENNYNKNDQQPEISYLLLPLSQPWYPEPYSPKASYPSPVLPQMEQRQQTNPLKSTKPESQTQPSSTTTGSVSETLIPTQFAAPDPPTESSVSDATSITSTDLTTETGTTAKLSNVQKEVKNNLYNNPLYRIDFYAARAKSGLSTPVPYEDRRSAEEVKYIRPSATYSVPEELGSYPVIHRKATARKPARTEYEVPEAAKDNAF